MVPPGGVIQHHRKCDSAEREPGSGDMEAFKEHYGKLESTFIHSVQGCAKRAAVLFLATLRSGLFYLSYIPTSFATSLSWGGGTATALPCPFWRRTGVCGSVMFIRWGLGNKGVWSSNLILQPKNGAPGKFFV